MPGYIFDSRNILRRIQLLPYYFYPAMYLGNDIWPYVIYGQKGHWESSSPLLCPQESSTKYFSWHILYVADSVIVLQYLNGKLMFGSTSQEIDWMKFPDGIHHIPSFTPTRSRWFPLAFQCDNVKANLVHAQKSTAREERVLQDGDLPSSSGSPLAPPPLPGQCLPSQPQK